MAVYLIRRGECGPVKIGKAIDPKGRMADLQVGSPERLIMLRAIEGYGPEEAALHERFASLQISREWFDYHDDMLGEIGFKDIEPSVRVKTPRHPLHAYLIANAIHPLDFAKQISVTGTALYRYMAADRIPRRAILERIVQATKGAVQANDFFASAQARQAMMQEAQ